MDGLHNSVPAAHGTITAAPIMFPANSQGTITAAQAIARPAQIPLTVSTPATVSLATMPTVATVKTEPVKIGAPAQIASGVSTVPTTSLPQTTPTLNTRPAASSSSTETKVLDKRRLQELVKEIDPLEQLDEDVEEMLMQIADDFIDNVVTASCQMAKHRKSNSVDVKDVQLHLERNWNMWIPGFGAEELRPYKKAATTEAHKQRLALIKKTLKKS